MTKKPPSKAMQRWDTEGGAAENGPQQGPRKKRPRDPNQLAKSIVDIATGETSDGEETTASKRASVAGRKGGPARAANLTPEERSKIARLAASARWKKS